MPRPDIPAADTVADTVVDIVVDIVVDTADLAAEMTRCLTGPEPLEQVPMRRSSAGFRTGDKICEKTLFYCHIDYKTLGTSSI